MEPSSGVLNLVEVGRRLADIRGSRNQKDYAAALGIHANTLGRYERGESPIDADTLFKLRLLEGIDLNDLLMGGTRPVRPAAVIADDPESPLVMVPLYNLKLGGGAGHINWETEQIGVRGYDRAWLQAEGLKPKYLGCGFLVGRSMESQILDGDLVLFNREESVVQSGKPYVIRVRDELMVKYLSRLPDGKVLCSSENTAMFPPFTIPDDGPDGDSEIVGSVRSTSRGWR